MTRALRLFRLSLLLLFVAGCDLTCLAGFGDVLGTHEEAAEVCCQCLATSRVGNPGTSCEDAFFVDAGPQVHDEDGGTVECLCSGDDVACKEALLAGEPVLFLGVCTLEPSACQNECAGVFAYP
jgi:hypothetical protein